MFLFSSRLVDADVNVFLYTFSTIWAEIIFGFILYCLAFAYSLTRGVCSYIIGSIVSSHTKCL